MESRKHSIPVRLTEQEYTDIKNQAKANDMNASEYMRDRIFKSGDFQAMQLTRELERLREGINKNFTVIDNKITKLKDDSSLRLSVLQECLGKTMRVLYYFLNMSSRFIMTVRSNRYEDSDLLDTAKGLKKYTEEPADLYDKDLEEFTEKHK